MENQDHKMISTSAVHEGHGVHLCPRCGWPFPNPHPSAKHRRAHKRVCGTIEGYEIINSEEHDHRLTVSDDEQASDDDSERTPSPKPVKKNDQEFGGSGEVGEKSNKSEDDVFSDAVTEFADSGISPRLEERFQSMDKSMECKSVESDVYEGPSLKADEDADGTKPLNDPTSSKEISKPGAPVSAIDLSGSVALATDSRAEVSVGPTNDLRTDVVKSEILKDVAVDDIEELVGGENEQSRNKSGQDTDIHGKEVKSGFANMNSKEDIISEPALIAVEKEEELCDKLVSDVDKCDISPQIEILQNTDANAEAESKFDSAATACSAKTSGEIALAEGTHQNDASVGLKNVPSSVEDIGSIGAICNPLPEESQLSGPSVKSGESMQTSDAAKSLDAVSSIDKKVEQNASLAGDENDSNFDTSEGVKRDAGGNSIGNLESEDKLSVEMISAPGCVDNTFTLKDDQSTRVLKEHVNQCEEKLSCKSSEAGKEKAGGASQEVQVTLDSTVPLEKSTDTPCSSEADGSAKKLEELSKPKSSSLESRDDGSEKSFQVGSSNEVTQKLQSTGSAGLDAKLNHGDVLDKSSLTVTLEDPVSQVSSEQPDNIHVTGNIGVRPVPGSGTVSESKHSRELVASEGTPNHPIPKDSTSPFTDSELLSENSAKENCCIGEGVKASGSIDAVEVSAELNHESNVVVLIENSESSNARVQEHLPAEKYLNNISPDADERHTNEDVNTSKSVGIVLNAEQPCEGNAVKTDECSVTPSLKDLVSASLHSQDLHESSATGDDKNIISIEHVSSVHSKSLQDKGDDKLTKPKDGVAELDLFGSPSSIADSLEVNCGSVSEAISESTETLVTNSQKHKATTEEPHSDKLEASESNSFVITVQSEGVGNQVATASEIETPQNNQQPKSDALQASSCPSLTNVVGKSEIRKKNEEVLDKVANWSPVKQHSPLKNLLNEPETKQVPASNQKEEAEPKNNGVGVTTASSVVGPEAPSSKDNNIHKDIEEWNSPARYPIEIKKEKKKGKSYWVPFLCCSSVHRDL